MNSVSAVGAGMNGVNSKPNKKSNLGAKIGAGVGVAVGAVRAFKKREMINQLGDSLILAGQSRAVANISKIYPKLPELLLESDYWLLLVRWLGKGLNPLLI